MAHAFRLGPLSTGEGDEDGELFVYLAIQPSGVPEVVHGIDDVVALQELVEALPGERLVVEPALAAAGKRLGLPRARLPAPLAHLKAAMALRHALGDVVDDDVDPPHIGDLLDAAAAFVHAAPWRFLDGDTPLRVEVLEPGEPPRVLDGSLMGQGEEEYGVVLYDQPGALAQLLACPEGEHEALMETFDLLAVSLETEPAWVVKAIDQALGFPALPVPMRLRKREPHPTSARDFATLAAALRAAAEIGRGTRKAEPTAVRGRSGSEPRVEVVLHLPAAEVEPARARTDIGRNAPCPCGSGRKYKRCCLPQDQAAERARSSSRSGGRSSSSSRSSDPAAFEADLAVAVLDHAERLFPGWRRGLPPAWDELKALPGAAQLVMPLLAFGREVAPGLTALGSYLAASPSLSPGERALLQAQQAAWLSVWEVLAVKKGVGLGLHDLLTGEQCFVHEKLGSEGATIRDALLARVIELDGRRVISGLHPQPLGPAAALEVVTEIRRRVGLKVKPIAPDRLAPVAIVDALVEQWQAAIARRRAAQLVQTEVHNTDGEPFQPHEDRFAIVNARLPEVVNALVALPDVGLDEHGRTRAELTFTKPGNAMHLHWPCTVLGTVTVERRALVLRANSAVRIDELRARLEQALGPRLVHRGRTREPVKTVQGLGTEGPVALDAMAMGWWNQPMELLMREQARHYIETTSDALGGLTPRRAMATAQGRRALHQLLKECEHASARGGAPDFAQYVRQTLGLSWTGEVEPRDERDRRTGHGRKISETLLDFAAPLLFSLDDPKAARPALELAALVWNLEVIEHDRRDSQWVTLMRNLVSGSGLPESSPWIERLRERRRMFAPDARLIEVVDVRVGKDGDLHVKAAALMGSAPAAATRRAGKKPRAGKKQLGLFE